MSDGSPRRECSETERACGRLRRREGRDAVGRAAVGGVAGHRIAHGGGRARSDCKKNSELSVGVGVAGARPSRRLAATGLSVSVAAGKQARWSGGAGMGMPVPGRGWQQLRGAHVTFAVGAKAQGVLVQGACADAVGGSCGVRT